MSYTKNVAFSSKTPEWYTPSKYIEAARKVLGKIELDAASCEVANQWVKADRYFCVEDNSLWQMWQAKSVWLNPPFYQSAEFVNKMLVQWYDGQFEEGILLCKFVPTYKWFQKLIGLPMVVTDHRVSFWKSYQEEGDSATDLAMAFVYFSKKDPSLFYSIFSDFGFICDLKKKPKKSEAI